MSSTHLSLHYHLVFGTKNHEAIITSDRRERFHAYLGGMVRTLDCVPEIVGGVADHVHILAGMHATRALADVMREIKSSSSAWVHREIGIKGFQWQTGYGAFTVSASQRETVRLYIARQEEHHRTRTFREEYIELLRRSGVEFEERFV